MRKQVRPPPPAEFVEHAPHWTDQWLALKTANPSARFAWYEVRGKTAREIALPLLRAMSEEHCAFCDCYPLPGRSTEPLEHFRPKSRPEFWNRAYDWGNLFYSCEKCQASKREQWNDALLRPDADDYRFRNYFYFDYTTGELLPNASAPAEARQRADVTIQIYGLASQERNLSRRLELRKWEKSSGSDVNDWSYRDYLEGSGLLATPPFNTENGEPATDS